MPNKVKTLLEIYTEQLKLIYGNNFKTVILYGSYARGDFNESSDIDIMILVDIDDYEIKKYADEVSDKTFDINIDNDVMFMPIVKNKEHFERWINLYSFYRNISKEGEVLYAA